MTATRTARPPRIAWTAETSGYSEGHGRAGQVRRAHLIPPDGTFPGRGVPAAACGQSWWPTTDAPLLTLPIGEPLPGPVTWCPKCQGVAAEQLGLTDRLAALIAEAVSP